MQPSFDIVGGYSYDPHISEIRNKLTNSREVFFGSDAWDSLQEGLYKKFSSGATVIILEMGFAYGNTFAASALGNVEQSFEARVRSANQLGNLMTKAGWGTVSISGDLDEGSRISMLVKNCAFCNTKHPNYPCFLRGVGLGVVSTLYGQQYKSSSQCPTGKEEHLCKIELQLSKLRSWNVKFQQSP